MSWLVALWEQRQGEAREEFLKLVTPDLDAVPGDYGTPSGHTTDYPWSAVLGARTRARPEISLGHMRYHLGVALGVVKVPDCQLCEWRQRARKYSGLPQSSEEPGDAAQGQPVGGGEETEQDCQAGEAPAG